MDISLYAKLLENRQKSRQIQQLSWTLNKLESKYQLDDLTPEEMETVNNFYNKILKEYNAL